MNNIQLNIVANAQFQQVYAEVAKLKEAMASLQKVSVGGPFAPGIAAEIKTAQSAFDSAIQSTRAFTIQHVAMADSVTKFGKQLEAGKLSLNNYYKIWRESVRGTSTELDALAASQARLNRSVAIADPLRPGYAKLVTDINGVVTAQEKAIFYQKALNTALHDGAMKLIDFGKNTQWMGRQLTVGLTMPIAMAGAGMATLFKQVDAELTRMQKVYGTGLIQPTAEQLKQIRSQVTALGQDLARTLGTSMKETASMSADLAATGLQGASLVNATREAIRLATLGELDHQQAMQATVSLQNVYKLSTQGLSDAVNFLNAVENQTSTSLQDLVDAIPRVGPIVQQLGGSFKDTAAMMVAMKEAGVPAAQGANAIKSALSSLINPTKNAQNAFKAYNIDIAKIATETGGKPIMMLKELADQMKGLDRLAQAQLIEKLFGKFQFARIQALIDNINKAGSQTATVFQLMGASSSDLATLAANELKQQTQSASGQFKRMVETLKADFLPIGESFLHSFTKIGNMADKLLHVFTGIAHVLGPVSGLLGKVFGGGLAGMVLIGPILMLTGLFANLIGNLLKGANYIRMFRQGVDQATPSTNKFVAGIQNLRNFYENLDLGMVAARNQLDLMPESITSNAKAFDILNASIRALTLQFEALAAAQASAMGMPAPGKAGGLKLPGFANGGWVPGNPSHGDAYPAMLTGKEFVVPYPQSTQYAPFLNGILKGNIPGFNGGGSTALGHMAENFAYDSSQGSSFLAANPGLQKFINLGGIVRIMSNLTARISSELNAALRSGSATKEQFASGWEAGQPLRFAESAVKGGLGINRLADPKMQAVMNQFEEELKNNVLALDKQHLADADIYAETKKLIAKYELMGGEASEFAGSLKVASQTIGGFRSYMSKELVEKAIASGEMQRVVSTKSKYPWETGILKVGGTTVGEFGGSRGEGRVGDLSRNKYALRGAVKEEVETIRLAFKEFARIKSPSDLTKVEVGDPLTAGVAAGMISAIPKVETAASQVMQAVQQELDFNVPQIGNGIGGRLSESVFLGSTIPLRPGMEPVSTSATMLQRLRRGVSGPGGLMAASMLAPMAIGMVPDKIGGTDISGVKSTAQSALSAGTMAAMFSTAGVGVAIGGAIVGISVLSHVFTKMANDMRENSNLLKSEFSVSSLAAQHLGVGLNNLSNVHLLSVDTKSKNLADAMSKNKEAVDALTQSYKSATDQQTKDTLKKISGMSTKELQSYINKTYATYLSTGSDPEKARKEIAAQLAASGKTNLSMLDITMPKYSTSAQGFQQALSGIGPLSQFISGGRAGGAVISTAGSQSAGLAIQNLAMSSPTNATSVIKNLKDWQKTILENNQVYKEFVNNIRQSNPDFANLIEKTRALGASTESLAQATSLVNAGFLTTTQEFQDAATNLEYLNSLMSVWTDLQTLSDKAVVTKGTAAKAQEDAQALIKSKEDAIKKIEKEKSARDTLYSAQMRNIEAQQQQMNMEADVVKARGSGDLVALAVAKQNLQIQRTKDAMQAAKDRADTGSAARIAKLQDEINALQSSKSAQGTAGTPGSTGPSQRTQAMELIKKAMQDAQTNAEQFAKDLPNLYASILKVVKDPKIAQDALTAALAGMKWSDFTTNIGTIFDGLVKAFGSAAKAAKVVIGEIKLEFVKGTKTINFTPTQIQKIADDIASLFTVDIAKDPAHTKALLKGMNDFMQELSTDINSGLKGADLANKVMSQAKEIAKAVYGKDSAEANGKFHKNYQDLVDQLTKAAGTDLGIGIGKGSKDASAKGQSVLQQIVNDVTGLIKGIFNIPSNLVTGVWNSLKSSVSGLISGLFGGNTTTKKAKGGIIHAASGMLVGPGGPTSDLIPAMLSNGEYVINAGSVAKYGSEFMDNINNGSYRIDNGINKYAPAILSAANSKSVSIPSYSMDAKRVGDMANIIGNSSSNVSNTINVYPPAGADANTVANIVIGKINQAMGKQTSRRNIK